MKKRSTLIRFALNNIGIAAFGALVPLLSHVSPFFDGKEAIFGAVAGLYWIPPLRNAATKRMTRRSAQPRTVELAPSSSTGGAR